VRSTRARMLGVMSSRALDTFRAMSSSSTIRMPDSLSCRRNVATSCLGPAFLARPRNRRDGSKISQQQMTARPQNAATLMEKLRDVGIAMAGLDVQDSVERAIGERQRLGVADEEIEARPAVLGSTAANCAVGGIKSGQRSWLQAFEDERGPSAASATDLQDIFVSEVDRARGCQVQTSAHFRLDCRVSGQLLIQRGVAVVHERRRATSHADHFVRATPEQLLGPWRQPRDGGHSERAATICALAAVRLRSKRCLQHSLPMSAQLRSTHYHRRGTATQTKLRDATWVASRQYPVAIAWRCRRVSTAPSAGGAQGVLGQEQPIVSTATRDCP
jgi:hypothetical protein